MAVMMSVLLKPSLSSNRNQIFKSNYKKGNKMKLRSDMNARTAMVYGGAAFFLSL